MCIHVYAFNVTSEENVFKQEKMQCHCKELPRPVETMILKLEFTIMNLK